ncbi:hypothetical protein EDD16DRAFT_1499425 [Pisolithus croceorrhizus]|nr:hypothetical protein EDD16DRAFT_1499425 [Pisolithus croceorrhizus]
MMGPTGSGKSAFINALIPPKSSSYIQVGHWFESETDEVRHIEWVNDDGLRIKLVDTPGFNDAREGPTDTEVLKMIASFLEEEHKAQMSKIVGLIYMHPVSDTRVGGTLGRNLRMFYKLCGQDSLKNVVIVVSTRNEVTPEEWRRKQEILSSDNLFKPLVDGGAIVRRHDGARGSASEIVNCLLGKDHATTQIVRELVHERKALEETSAGVELRSELRASLQKHMRQLEILEGELKLATTPLAKKELVEQKSTVKQSMSNLNQQLNGLECHSGTCEM